MRSYFAFAAIVLIVGATLMFLRRWSVAVHGVTAFGKVVAFESREDDESIHYLPVIVFTDRQGRSHRFTSVAGGADRHPPVGSSVLVRYLPDNPEQAFISSFLHMWAAPLALLALGGGALLAYFRW